ncbi:unnamed protein product [Pleuronectes platessa]|uniref:Uncharacterized protein n=1 Tax=Pleuronectes platessa TaxID=8262 RepID=A0A9N7YTR8_PLEPL|nr:unnamed protein product [Pleuronectes platessa]
MTADWAFFGRGGLKRQKLKEELQQIRIQDLNILGLRSSLELKMTNHQALAIVFQLEHVFSAPIGRETMVRGMHNDA